MIEKIIDQKLRAAGLKNRRLRSELLDHFMCSYEFHLEQYGDPSLATGRVVEEINSNDLGSLNHSYFILNLKSNIHMNVLCFSLVTVLAFFGFSQMNDEDPPSIIPIKDGIIVSEFGMRIHPIKKIEKMHTGIDIKAAEGTAVFAPEYAVVKETGYHNMKGNYIVLSHDEIYETQYFHLKEIVVSTNQEISKGTFIGTVGSTGASIKAHLHYELLKNGKQVDPKDYL